MGLESELGAVRLIRKEWRLWFPSCRPGNDQLAREKSTFVAAVTFVAEALLSFLALVLPLFCEGVGGAWFCEGDEGPVPDLGPSLAGAGGGGMAALRC